MNRTRVITESASSPINRRDFLRVAGVSAASLGLSMSSHAATAGTHDAKIQGRPNVLIIICDDLNDSVERMGGHPQAKTPSIDALTRRGVRFVNAQCNAPICGPSRASVWTGLYPHTTGYYGYKQQHNDWRNNHVLKDSVTVFEHFKSHGYDVYGTGKVFHNGHEDWSVFRRDDVYGGFEGFGVEPDFGPWPWDGKSWHYWNRPLEVPHPSVAHYDRTGWSSFGPLSDVPDVPPDPEKGTPGYDGWMCFRRPFRYVSETDRDLMPDEQSARWVSWRLADLDRERPFMMTVGMNRPHQPWYAPQKYFDMFPLDEIELPPYLENDLEDCPEILWKDPNSGARTGYARALDLLLNAGGTEFWKRWIQAYLACVAFVDDQVGTIVQALEANGFLDNTIIVFTSDHGWHMGEKNHLSKNTTWEETTRVPLVVVAPGLTEAGGTCEAPVSLIDLYPTLNDLCELSTDPNAKGNRIPLDGHSLQPLLKHPAKGQWNGPPVALSCRYGPDDLAVDEPGRPERQHFSVRSTHWRYTRCSNGEEELYDHRTDPHEWHNLASEPRHVRIKRDLYDELLKLVPLHGAEQL